MRRTKAEALRTRAAILKAAARIMARQGVNAFTLEAVAQAAGVTKGGVLHHFPSKEALIDGLISQTVEGFNARLASELAASPAGQAGHWLRAYIRSMLAAPLEETSLIPALATVVAAEPQTLERIRNSVAASQLAAVQDGLDPTQATIIRLAVDGVVLAGALGIDVLEPAARQAVADELMRLTYPTRLP